MFIVFGLGNSGKKYQATRHNVGARAVEKLELTKPADIILARPAGFMNESGRTIKPLLKLHKLKTEDLIVVHDDLDIPLGEIRIAKNRGAAGHKGVASVIKELGTKDFIRIRIGILPKTGKAGNSEKFVLQKFNKNEERLIGQAIAKATAAVETLLRKGPEKTMAECNCQQ